MSDSRWFAAGVVMLAMGAGCSDPNAVVGSSSARVVGTTSTQASRVMAITPAGHRVSAPVRADGSFSLPLPSGTYRVVLVDGQRIVAHVAFPKAKGKARWLSLGPMSWANLGALHAPGASPVHSGLHAQSADGEHQDDSSDSDVESDDDSDKAPCASSEDDGEDAEVDPESELDDSFDDPNEQEDDKEAEGDKPCPKAPPAPAAPIKFPLVPPTSVPAPR